MQWRCSKGQPTRLDPTALDALGSSSTLTLENSGTPRITKEHRGSLRNTKDH